MKTNIYRIGLAAALLFSTACTDLDLEPRYDQTPNVIYSDFQNYKPLLAKLYAGLALTGQVGPAGDGTGDIAGLDEGYSSYIRLLWKLQELPTDEAVIAWNDRTILDFHQMDWTSRDPFITAMFARIYFQIPQINAFLRETTPEKLNERGIASADQEQVKVFRAEARFLRALSYWHAIDLFGDVPFVTEEDVIGKNPPRQISRADLFNYVEEEILAIEADLVVPGQNEYARVDQAAAWMLLSKLYLNAEVYIQQDRYADVITYTTKVINSGYTLDTNYDHLFLADNHTAQGMIFPVAFDGTRTQTYGGTTFIINASIGGSMTALDYGTNGKWAGLRTTKEFVALFPDGANSEDSRAMFYVGDNDSETDDQTLEIDDVTVFTQGYAVTKFKNLTSGGQQGSDPGGNFADTDFPMFRLADAYLMYAEAVVRGGGGDMGTAVQYINALRERAYNGPAGNITTADLDLDFLLAERGRELYWEAQRRTDLIRFGKFTTGDYLWAWKGGVKEGKSVEATRVLYPIPAADLVANPNLEQNPGYN